MSQMSSDEEELTSPHLPQDSDRGSSVSSELQEEYEELLRFAVVTPKYDPSVPSQLIHSSSSLKPAQNSSAMDSARSEAVEDVRGNGRRSSPVREVISATCPQQLEGSRPQSQVSEGEEVASRSDRGSEGTHSDSDRSGKSSPDHVINVMMEMFVSEENLNKMEDILDTWSNNLKSNVMMELRRWKIAFVEQHRLEMTKEREKHAAHVAGINAEMDSLKDLLNTYQISNQRKDEVIVNLTRAVDRQRERVELMRSFTQWRLQHSAVKEEAQASKLAEQHYQLQLKKKVWAAWHSLIQRGWRERAERACRARAEEVCLQLSADYEAKLAEHAEALQKAQAEIQRLHRERERYEDSMKKAFMRGVCALNIEALSMFHTADTGRQEQGFPVETVEEYKYLGTILDCQLRFSSNTEGILRKCHQRMYLLRKLNSFSVSQNILLTFYYTFIESVLAFSICCWYYSITVQDRNRLHNIVKVCSKIIALPARHLNTVYDQQASGLARRILKDSTRAFVPGI
ncbi:centrosomal protein POC5 isoform X5 [Neoarius graeffei]|uniref:centrosomal protein POC5 isoform X5 n=1 Tax=Neoarius graeffei TaxID=443677 RepID=UPI00298C6C1B|nr:centrosomal protein POC5 isoform X5 [Neoarius graeffei]